jgi:2'-5' RNA ligase
MSGAYDTAVIYFLEENDAAFVSGLQTVLADGVVRGEPPHFTLLYLGKVAARQFEDVAAALESKSWPALDARVSGVGAFSSPERLIAHLEIAATPALIDAHRHAYAACEREPWFAPGPWSRDGWRPHITIFAGRIAPDVKDQRLQRAIGRVMPLRRAALVAAMPGAGPAIIRELKVETE